MDFTIKISSADVVFIGNLLAEQPYKQVAAIINRIQAQLDEQQKAAIASATSAVGGEASAENQEAEVPVEAVAEAA